MSKQIETTERLMLREFSLKDSAFLIQLVNSKGWLQFIGDRNVRNIEQAYKYIEERFLGSYKKNGYGMWCVELIETQQPIGACGLVNRDTLDDTDIGFALLPEYEGKGYALEAAKAVMEYAKQSLNIDRIIAIVNDKNVASIKLIEKLGMVFEKRKSLNDSDEVLVYGPKKAN